MIDDRLLIEQVWHSPLTLSPRQEIVYRHAIGADRAVTALRAAETP
jgi:hypothetical protein